MDISGIFQFIGALASIIGLTYAFYIAKNNRRLNIEKAKERILDKLLFIIGYENENEYDSVEFLSVINSVLRQYKIDENKVLPSEIIEDFMAEIICNPLLSSNKKNEINNKLKTILNEFVFAQGLLNLNDEQKKIVFESDVKDTAKVKKLIENNILNKSDYEKSKKRSKIYDVMMMILFIIIFIFFMLVIILTPENKNDLINANWLIVIISFASMIFIIYDNIRKRKK